MLYFRKKYNVDRLRHEHIIVSIKVLVYKTHGYIPATNVKVESHNIYNAPK